MISTMVETLSPSPLPLPPLPDVLTIQRRLELIFPEGTENRNYLVRDMAARTVFVMLYTGAVEGAHQWIRPNQVTRMSDKQASKTDEVSRRDWTKWSLTKMKGDVAIPGRWYADNTREPIRDESIKGGFLLLGAVVHRAGLAVTSDRPSYALEKTFANLLVFGIDTAQRAELVEKSPAFAAAIQTWREKHLSTEARARIRLSKQATTGAEHVVLVTFPNGETRRLSHGPSSDIAKAVIEVFAPCFLVKPMVVLVSDSALKTTYRDDSLTKAINLNITPATLLPDILIVDLGLEGARPLLVFVEIVATDGPIDRARKEALTKLATDSGHGAERLAFVTAFKTKRRKY